MNEAVTKRFLLYFRLMLLVWILIANAIIHVTGLEYSWLIFLSNIMMFTLEGDVKDRFVTVELGGLVGLILTVIALLSITALNPVLGGFFGFLIPLAVVLFILIILHPYAPKVLNNVGFAYLTVACIDTTALATHLPQFFITFIVGSILFNGVCVLLMKPAKALAVKSVQKETCNSLYGVYNISEGPVPIGTGPSRLCVVICRKLHTVDFCAILVALPFPFWHQKGVRTDELNFRQLSRGCRSAGNGKLSVQVA